MTTISGEPDGQFSLQEIDYLEERARNGIGLVMTPACYIHKSGHAFERQVGCHSEAMMDRLCMCAKAINRHGAASFLQIHHGGNAAKQAYTGMRPWAPSSVQNRRGTSELPQAMIEEQILTLIAAFGQAAERAQCAGFTGIEIHGANTYLLQQFFSPYTNRRDDKWGAQNLENRTRFAREVVKAVRSRVGDDYPVSFRVSPEEEEPSGYSTYETIEYLKLLIDEGIDIVHISSWDYGTYVRNDLPWGLHPTLAIRRALPGHVPVIGVGSVNLPEHAMRILDEVELVALGRALLLEPRWLRQVRDNRLDEIKTALQNERERQQLRIPDRMKEYSKRFFVID